jgi:CRP/FNR family cyclic AMP-dependent transcriptional regulator
MERLKKIPLFQDMTDRDLGEISRDLTFNQYERGEVMVNGADMGRNLHLLLEGRARLIAVGRSGREIVLESIGPGEIFGERGPLRRKPRPRLSHGGGRRALPRPDDPRRIPQALF